MLRALGDRVPGGIVAERHDLGEVNRDPHWVDSPRYGRRLRASVETLNEWREGDIVRMGFIPPSSNPGPLHKFSFHTDAEGFRNPRGPRSVRHRRAWRFVHRRDDHGGRGVVAVATGRPARRAGAELRHGGLRSAAGAAGAEGHVAAHRPRTVVLAFFAGNDIFDAEAFDAFQRSGGAIKRAATGMAHQGRRQPRRLVVRRQRVARRAPLARRASGHRDRGGGRAGAADRGAGRPTSASFDRGWFDLPVAGRRLRWAFMPPYLNTLNFSREDLAARPAGA